MDQHQIDCWFQLWKEERTQWTWAVCAHLWTSAFEMWCQVWETGSNMLQLFSQQCFEFELMRYLWIKNLFPAVGCCQHSPSLEKQTGAVTQALQSVCLISENMLWSQLQVFLEAFIWTYDCRRKYLHSCDLCDHESRIFSQQQICFSFKNDFSFAPFTWTLAFVFTLYMLNWKNCLFCFSKLEVLWHMCDMSLKYHL